MSDTGKIPTDGGQGLGQNPFGALSGAGLPVVPQSVIQQAAKKETPARNRGRVDIKRTTAGRGGKTVTLVTGFDYLLVGLRHSASPAQEIGGRRQGIPVGKTARSARGP